MKQIKFITLCTMLIALQFSSVAQDFVAKGTSLVGGSIIYSRTSNDDEVINLGTNAMRNAESTTDLFTIAPSYAYAIKDGLMLGTSIGYTRQNNELQVSDTDFGRTDSRVNKIWNFSLFLRRYYEIKDRFGAFIEPRVGYAINQQESEFTSTDGDGQIVFNSEITERTFNTFTLGANLGLYYFISDRFSLETTLGNLAFSTSSSKFDSSAPDGFSQSATSENFNLRLINTLSFDQILSFNYFF
ncbi:MAG: hypothetical protein AAFO69_17735 [Bacteroidota bacterium]